MLRFGSHRFGSSAQIVQPNSNHLKTRTERKVATGFILDGMPQIDARNDVCEQTGDGARSLRATRSTCKAGGQAETISETVSNPMSEISTPFLSYFCLIWRTVRGGGVQSHQPASAEQVEMNILQHERKEIASNRNGPGSERNLPSGSSRIHKAPAVCKEQLIRSRCLPSS